MYRDDAQSTSLAAQMRTSGYISSTEVAAIIGKHKSTIYRWIKDGLVDAIDFNGAYYIQWASVIEHLGAVAAILGWSKTEIPKKKMEL